MTPGVACRRCARVSRGHRGASFCSWRGAGAGSFISRPTCASEQPRASATLPVAHLFETDAVVVTQSQSPSAGGHSRLRRRAIERENHRPISGVYASPQLRAGRPGEALGLITRHGDRFSHNTCLPVGSARTDHSTCWSLGSGYVHRVNAQIREQRLVRAVWFYAIEPSGGRQCCAPARSCAGNVRCETSCHVPSARR